MPELSVMNIALLAMTAVVGLVVGWVLRSNRSGQEKALISASWQDQLESQYREHERLIDQNKDLMEQVSELQASNTDARNRAQELSLAVQEAFARRDELQRDIKDIRGNLEVAVNERDKLASNVDEHDANEQLLRAKDQRIAVLTKELENWQNRLPPLIERFRVRNTEAEKLEIEIEQAHARIRELEEDMAASSISETRVEPVNYPEELTDGLDASNDAVEIDEDFTTWEKELLEPTGNSDDLKMIKGVGPAIEKTLKEMGIVSLQQIADMTEYDIDRVAKRLKGFHSRIQREDWIGQARTLLGPAANG